MGRQKNCKIILPFMVKMISLDVNLLILALSYKLNIFIEMASLRKPPAISPTVFFLDW